MPHRTAAFTLPQTMVGVALSLVTLAMSVPVFRWCSVSLHNSQIKATTDASFDHTLDLLRRDVWQAQKMQRFALDGLILTTPAGQVSWEFDDAGTIHRRGPDGAEQRWHPGLGIIGIDQRGAVVTLTIPGSPGPSRHPGYVVGMTSPAMALNSGAQP